MYPESIRNDGIVVILTLNICGRSFIYYFALDMLWNDATDANYIAIKFDDLLGEK